ncbi:MAG TPA: winged helix-turn-helix domain-containing protein [Terriglobales bacterium]|nr:winged helix-turn-helix domain-containing protein [Terriglobales bacterium]
MMGNKSFIFCFADVEVREREFSLIKGGEAFPVEPKAFRVLLILLRNPQKLITKEELLNAVWGDAAVTENSLTRSIALLRRLLGDDIRNPRYIETVATVGYRFVSKVEVSEEAAGDLEATGKTNGRSEGDFVGTLANGEIAEDAANPVGQIDRGAGYTGKSLMQASGRRNRPSKWALSGAVLLAVGLAAAAWYLRRPLPPPRVSEYIKITHDGHPKDIAGTDGSRLYLNRIYDPQRIAEVAISGGEIVQVPIALPLPWIHDVSPDGSTLLVTSSDGDQWSLWNVQVPAGTLRRLLTDARVVSAAWSPDGKSVVYSTNGDLYMIRSDGTGTHKLAAAGGLQNELSWSPDGSKIRFSRDNRLWEMSSDGTGLHPLLPGWHTSVSQCCGRWTPDGKFFVFLSRGGFYAYNGFVDASQLWALDERRSLFRQAHTDPVQLTSGPIRWNTPIPSKDGTKIFAHGVILRGELDRYDAQSGRPQPYLGGISADQVTFSRDGQFVAYVTFPEGILWRANRDGSRPVQLTDSALYPLNPSWSPDGSQILFCNYDSKGHVGAYVISSQGGTPRPLLPEDREGQSDPNWSPDGQKILFSALEKFGAFDSVLRVLDLASHQVMTVPGSEGAWSAQWSPNGRFILAMSAGRTGGMKIFDFEMQRWTALRAGDSDFPTWSSDSQFIYFLLPYDNPGVFRIRASGGDAERVVDLKGFRYTGAFTLWMGLDPTDTPMLLRDVGTDDIYALTLEER